MGGGVQAWGYRARKPSASLYPITPKIKDNKHCVLFDLLPRKH